MISIMDEMFELVRQALNREYAYLMPAGFEIYKLAEYTPERFPAPNLWLEKREYPEARYLAILSDDRTASVPALGVTVNDAVKRAIIKIESFSGQIADSKDEKTK